MFFVLYHKCRIHAHYMDQRFALTLKESYFSGLKIHVLYFQAEDMT